MKSNNRIVTVMMPWSANITFTKNDIVFGVENTLTNNNPEVLLVCTQEARGNDQLDSDHFKPFVTSAYTNRAKNESEAVGPNKLVAASAIKSILSKIGGAGYNNNGIIEVLADGTDLNSINYQSKFRLVNQYTYLNCPTDISSANFAFVETTKVTINSPDIKLSQMVVCNTNNYSLVFYRTYYNNTWTSWVTPSETDATKLFNRCYTTRAAVYINSIKYLNKILRSVSDKVSKLVYSYQGSLSNYNSNAFDLRMLDEGYYKILIRNNSNGNQYSFDFNYEDVIYSNAKEEDILLANSSSNMSATIQFDNNDSTPKLSLTSSSTLTNLTIKVFRLPLTYISYV